MIDLKNRIQTLINASGISAPWSEILSIVDGVNASALALNNPSWLNMFNVVLGEQLEVDLMELRARLYEETSSKKLEESAKQGVGWLDQQRHLLQEHNEVDRHTIFMTGDLIEKE